MATVKEIIQEFCYRKNIPCPNAFVGVAAQTERYYLSLFKLIGDQLKAMPYDWPQLKKTYIFTTQTGVRRYQLPGDFYKILNDTTRDNTNRWGLDGPLSDSSFALQQYGNISTSTQKSYRLIGGQGFATSSSNGPSTFYNAPISSGFFEIDPVGANNTDQLMLQYIGKNWVTPVSWVSGTGYNANTLITGLGNIYQAVNSGTSGSVRPYVDSGTISDGGVIWSVSNASYTITTDNDICMFDTDVMIEGIRWAYQRDVGGDYAQEREDWINQIKSMFTRYNGPQMINAGDEDYGDYFWPNLPRVV